MSGPASLPPLYPAHLEGLEKWWRRRLALRPRIEGTR